MSQHLRAIRRAASITTAFALVIGGLLGAASARADSAPTDPTNPKTPTTVSADALPAPQIDGVVWTQTIVGNTVFAGGKFTTARPAGAAPGTNTVARPYLLSYNLTTGVLNTAFAPNLNGQVKAIVGSADGTKVYVSGAFTTVNGVTKNRIAELDATTGAIVTAFNPAPNYNTNALALSGNTLYLGGAFSSVNSSARADLAAVNATTGALLPWNPAAAGGNVTSLIVSPDATKVVVGGAFTSLNGSSNPGYGMGAVDATSGALLPWAINSTIRDAGTQAGVTAYASDASGVYGSVYDYTSGGNFEGGFHVDWSGNLIWMEDCHGDTYSLAVTPNAAYFAGHSHVCATLGGFPQTSPSWTYHRAVAFSKATTQTLTRSPDLANYAGKPAPSLLNWFPDIDAGTYTGQSQGPWSVAANSQYVVYGGEFTTVNGKAQQGLVRFAVPTIAPDKIGPSATGGSFVPAATSPSTSSIKLTWTANSDIDNTTLTYQVFRDGLATPIATMKQDSTFWNTPTMTYTDTGLAPGSTHSYVLKAVDPWGNTATGSAVSATVSQSSGNPGGGYSSTVLGQGPTDYWRLDQAAGATTLADSTGNAPLAAGAGVTAGATGAVADSDTASTFSGGATGFASTQTAVTGPQAFSIEAWIKTSSTAGGKIVGFGDSATGTSSKIDRHLYLTTDGKVNFGVHSGSNVVLTSPAALNDNQWHQVVGTLGGNGLQLFVDGQLVASNSATTTAQNYSGFWRVGGDKSWSGGYWFGGTIDDVAVFPTALSASQVAAQWTASGR